MRTVSAGSVAAGQERFEELRACLQEAPDTHAQRQQPFLRDAGEPAEGSVSCAS